MNKRSIDLKSILICCSVIFSGCAPLELAGTVASNIYDVENDVQYEGKLDYVEDLPDGNKKIHFVSGKDYTVFRIGRKDNEPFYHNRIKYLKIYKNDNGNWAEEYFPEQKEIYTGTVKELEIKSTNTLLRFDDGISYEVDGQPDVRPGDEVTIIQESDVFVVGKVKSK